MRSRDAASRRCCSNAWRPRRASAGSSASRRTCCRRTAPCSASSTTRASRSRAASRTASSASRSRWTAAWRRAPSARSGSGRRRRARWRGSWRREASASSPRAGRPTRSSKRCASDCRTAVSRGPCDGCRRSRRPATRAVSISSSSPCRRSCWTPSSNAARSGPCTPPCCWPSASPATRRWRRAAIVRWPNGPDGRGCACSGPRAWASRASWTVFGSRPWRRSCRWRRADSRSSRSARLAAAGRSRPRPPAVSASPASSPRAARRI